MEGARVEFDESFDERKGKPRAERVTGGTQGEDRGPPAPRDNTCRDFARGAEHLLLQRADGGTPLHESARAGHRGCTAALVQLSAKLDAKDSRGRSAMWMASMAGHDECVLLLLEVCRSKGLAASRDR